MLLTHSTTPVLLSAIRRYIAWTERGVVRRCRVLRLPLSSWSTTARIPEDVEILPLSECGTEHLLRKVHNETAFDSPGFVAATWAHALALRAAPHHDRALIFLARCGGRYVGYCIGRNPEGRPSSISGLGVHPGFRGRGLGRALLRTTLKELKERGAAQAILHSHPDNSEAIALYHSEGFTVTG